MHVETFFPVSSFVLKRTPQSVLSPPWWKLRGPCLWEEGCLPLRMKDGILGLGRLAWALGLDSWFSRPFWGMLYPVLLPSTGEAGGPERVQPQDQAWMFVTAVAVKVLGRGLIAASCG